MIVFPNCKINLGLHIIRKREDGYHDLETVFYPVPVHDALEVVKATENNPDIPFSFNATGLSINSGNENNLCVKAYQLIKKDFPLLPSLKMHLHKAIPMGAGLGGGSADGAFTLSLLNKKFQLNLSADRLASYALQLGSDCAFFIINKPSFATGRGEMLEEISLDLSSYKLLIINPGIHIPTPWAFSQIKPKASSKNLKEIHAQPISTWTETLFNDFEKPVMDNYPGLKSLKEQLYSIGAIYASMTGSGSTFFGFFPNSHKIPSNIFPEKYFIREVSLAAKTK